MLQHTCESRIGACVRCDEGLRVLDAIKARAGRCPHCGGGTHYRQSVGRSKCFQCGVLSHRDGRPVEAI